MTNDNAILYDRAEEILRKHNLSNTYMGPSPGASGLVISLPDNLEPIFGLPKELLALSKELGFGYSPQMEHKPYAIRLLRRRGRKTK